MITRVSTTPSSADTASTPIRVPALRPTPRRIRRCPPPTGRSVIPVPETVICNSPMHGALPVDPGRPLAVRGASVVTSPWHPDGPGRSPGPQLSPEGGSARRVPPLPRVRSVRLGAGGAGPQVVDVDLGGHAGRRPGQ